MDDIKRYSPDSFTKELFPSSKGQFVRYVDHKKIVLQARNDAIDECIELAVHHFIPEHSVAGKGFAAHLAGKLQALKSNN